MMGKDVYSAGPEEGETGPDELWCHDCRRNVIVRLTNEGVTCDRCGSLILCDYCGHPFSDWDDLDTHEEEEHPPTTTFEAS